MKVRIEVESTDMSGEVIKTTNNAVLEERDKDYKLSYVEVLSDSGQKTKTIMYINPGSVRIIREGEIKSDFMYAEGLTHNSLYQTAYGNLPVSVVTKSFSFIGNKMSSSEDLFESFPGIINRTATVDMNIDISYSLAVEGTEPMDMRVKIKVSHI